MKKLLIIFLFFPYVLYSQIQPNEYLYPDYFLTDKVIVEDDFEQTQIFEKTREYRTENINGKRKYSVYKGGSQVFGLLPGYVFGMSPESASSIAYDWEIKFNITINSTQFWRKGKIVPSYEVECIKIGGLDAFKDEICFTFQYDGHACLYYYKDGGYKIYKETKFDSFNSKSEVTIRKIDGMLYFFIDYRLVFEFSVDLLKKNQGIDLSQTSCFLFKIAEGNIVELDNLTFKKYDFALDINLFLDHSLKITQNCFSLAADSIMKFEVLNKDFKKVRFKDFTDKNKVNIVYAIRLKNLDEVNDLVQKNILNWQLKYNASVKVILVDGFHPNLLKGANLNTLLPNLDFYYWPYFQYLHPQSQFEIGERYQVYFVNQEGYFHYDNTNNGWDTEDLNEILNNYSNNFHYLDEDWNLTTKSEAKYYRKITKTNSGLFQVNDYYINGTVQMNGTYQSLYPKNMHGIFKWYNEKGKVTKLANYKKNIKEGEEVIYHSNGLVFTSRMYNNGLLWNIISLKNNKGADLEIGTFKNGSGVLNIYNSNGEKLIGKLKYSSGKLNGETVNYFQNGTIKCSINYRDDWEDGISTFYFRNGIEKYSINYTDLKDITIVEKSLKQFGESLTEAIKNSNVNYIKNYIILPTYKDNFVDENFTMRLIGLVLSQSYNGVKLDEELTLFEENYTAYAETYKNNTYKELEDFSQKILKNFLDNSNHFKNKIISLKSIEYEGNVKNKYDASTNGHEIKLIYNLNDGKSGSVKVLIYDTQYGWIFGGFR